MKTLCEEKSLWSQLSTDIGLVEAAQLVKVELHLGATPLEESIPIKGRCGPGDRTPD